MVVASELSGEDTCWANMTASVDVTEKKKEKF